MTNADVTTILRGIGWDIDRDEVGDVFCVFNLGDRQVQIIPSIAKRLDHYRIGFMPSVSTKEFLDAVSAIFGKRAVHQPIINRREIPTKIADPAAEDIVKMSDEVLNWAKCQDIEEGLRIYRELSTDTKGAMPLRHLAALAMEGG